MVTTTPANEQETPSEPGGINLGMLLRQGPITNPIVTIEVADMEAALQTVADKGGTVVRGKEPMGEVGFAAYFTDTEGNRSASGRAALPRAKPRKPAAACLYARVRRRSGAPP